MSEFEVLGLVSRYAQPTALARHAHDATLFPVLGRLESRGLVRRRRGLYRLTSRGRYELVLTRALSQLAVLASV